MPQILVWKCEKTGVLFEKQGDYALHLKSLAREARVAAKKQKLLDERNAVFTKMRETCLDARDIESFIKKNYKYFVLNEIARNPWQRDDMKVSDYDTLKDVGITLFRPFMKDDFHSAPLSAKRYGQGKSYTAIEGRIEIYNNGEILPNKERKEHIFTGAFDNTGINTGSASGSFWGFSGEFTLWLEDWPLMSEQAIIEKLS